MLARFSVARSASLMWPRRGRQWRTIASAAVRKDRLGRHGCGRQDAAPTAIAERMCLCAASRVRCAGLQKAQPALDPAPRRGASAGSGMMRGCLDQRRSPSGLLDAYRFAGFRPLPQLVGVFGDAHARVVRLVRRSKKRPVAAVVGSIGDGTTVLPGVSAICLAGAIASTSSSRCAGWPAQSCGGVKRERLEFLADNALYTKRFAYYVGRRCHSATVKDIAEELKLDWHTVKELDKQYMRAQLARAGSPAPKAIGIDEISIRKRHTYRIVVSDLIRRRPIWFGGEDRSEASMSQFYGWLGDKRSRGIGLAVMDMWKPFRNATAQHAPNAAILFDKFHVMRHLGEALDQVRKSEYARLSGKDRRFIKGQKYTLLSNRENLTLEGRQALKTLLAANKRLNTAYLLKESFGQLWSYHSEV